MTLGHSRFFKLMKRVVGISVSNFKPLDCSGGRLSTGAPVLIAQKNTVFCRFSLDIPARGRHTRHSTLDTRHSTLDTRHSTLDTRHSTLDTRHSTLDTRHSTLDYGAWCRHDEAEWVMGGGLLK